MTDQSITHYGRRDDIKELANRLQKMMPGAARFTEAEALTVAQIAIAHGLDPFNGEVWGIKYEKPANSGNWVWAGTMVGVKGLRKAARRQGNYWTEFRRVEPKQYNAADSAVVWECHLRDTDRVMAYGKSINALTSSGMPYSEAVQMLGPAPVYIGIGIATPDERSKMSIHHRAKKRAEADAIKQAYDVQFGGAMLENGSMVEGEVTVLGFDDDHALPAGQVVDVPLEPRPVEQVLEEIPFYDEPMETETVQQPAFDLQPKSLMTLEMAINETGSDGVKYGEKDTKTLAAMANTIAGKLKENGLTPEERENKQRKLDAIKVILADRAGE